MENSQLKIDLENESKEKSQENEKSIDEKSSLEKVNNEMPRQSYVMKYFVYVWNLNFQEEEKLKLWLEGTISEQEEKIHSLEQHIVTLTCQLDQSVKVH